MRSICIIFLLCANVIAAQEWPFESSRWIFDYNLVGGLTGQYELMMGQDTLVDGQLGQVMLKNQTYYWPQPDNTTIFTQTGFSHFQLMRTSGDSVFYYQSDQWMLLYDFGAEVGDSWYCHIASGEGACPDDTTWVEVIEIGTMDINGESRRYLWLETVSNSDFNLTGQIVEGIGMVVSAYTYALFPGVGILDQCGIIVEAESSTFKCYIDDEIGIYGEGNCGFVSLREETLGDLTFSPNPVEDVLNIRIPEGLLMENIEIAIYDLTGKEFKVDEITSKYVEIIRLNILNLAPGSYLLSVKSSSGTSSGQFLKL